MHKITMWAYSESTLCTKYAPTLTAFVVTILHTESASSIIRKQLHADLSLKDAFTLKNATQDNARRFTVFMHYACFLC